MTIKITTKMKLMQKDGCVGVDELIKEQKPIIFNVNDDDDMNDELGTNNVCIKIVCHASML